MGLFGRSGDAPPDIGKEEEYDEAKGTKDAGADEKLEKIKAKESVPQEIAREAKPVATGVPGVGSAVGLSNVQTESMNARIDSIVEWIKQFYDRFSYVSESIGEIRTMTMNNEKRLSEEMKEANKVIDVVKEVKPEELRINYQKSDMKMTALAEKIEANKLFMDEIMKEMNDLRRKSEVFVGTEGIMKLNADTKRDLVEVQKLASKTRMQVDKGQEIFMELRKGFADSQKVGAIVGNLDESYAGLKEAIDRLRLDHSTIVKRDDYLDFKKTYRNKLALFEGNLADTEKIKDNLSQMGDLIETGLAVSRRNEEDIGNIGLKIGEDSVKKVSDYENQMVEIVEIIEALSKQLAEVRKKVGLKANVVVDEKVAKPSEGGREKVAAVKEAEIPELKPEEFLGKKNIVEKRGEAEMAVVEKKIEKTEGDLEKKEVVEEVKPKRRLEGMIKKIVTRVKPKAKEKEPKKRRRKHRRSSKKKSGKEDNKKGSKRSRKKGSKK
jgi:hypothetical protein